MSSSPDDPADASAAPLRPAQVSEYLRQHPDFFITRPSLLEHLQVPHNVDGAASLVEHQVGLLREKNRKLSRQIRELMALARENEALLARVHALVLALIDAPNPTAAVQALDEGLRAPFKADVLGLIVFGEPIGRLEHPLVRRLAPDAAELEPFREHLERGEALCGRLRSEKLATLFGEQAERVGSTVVLPLGDAPGVGLLGVASFDAERFHPDMGTDFLRLLGQVLGRRLARPAKPPSQRRA